MSPRRGEVWRADLGYTAKVRPVVILSRDDPEPPRRITIFIPITTAYRGSQYEVQLPKRSFLNDGSVANAQGILSGPTADRTLFLEKIGELPAGTVSEIEQAVAFAIGA